MKNFVVELYRRNPLLSIAGWICIVGTIVCALMTQLSSTEVMGISAYIKPLKFFLSVSIFTWTMAWYMEYLQMPRRTLAYSIMACIVFAYELFVITWQAAHGRMSHFNITTPLYAMLFSIMGMAILLLWAWTIVVAIWFFRKRQFNLPMPYVWGIRAGLVIFLVFAVEGMYMAILLAHTVGAPDGGQGLPLVNWSTQHGDLRVAHFFGMHALQIIPLFSYFVFKKRSWVFVFAGLYFIFVSALLMQALNHTPLFF